MSNFAIDPSGRLEIAVELGPERSEALADCVGPLAGYSMDCAPARAFVDQEGKLHIVVQLRPPWKTLKARYDDPSDYFLGKGDHFERVCTFTYDAKDDPGDRVRSSDCR
jgi:hypothetical protein